MADVPAGRLEPARRHIDPCRRVLLRDRRHPPRCPPVAHSYGMDAAVMLVFRGGWGIHVVKPRRESRKAAEREVPQWLKRLPRPMRCLTAPASPGSAVLRWPPWGLRGAGRALASRFGRLLRAGLGPVGEQAAVG